MEVCSDLAPQLEGPSEGCCFSTMYSGTLRIGTRSSTLVGMFWLPLKYSYESPGRQTMTVITLLVKENYAV